MKDLRLMMEEKVMGMFYILLSRDYEGRDFQLRFDHAKRSVAKYTDEQLLSVYDTLKRENG